MVLLQRARTFCCLSGLSFLLGCSNGSGSLDEPETPPGQPAQPGFSIGGLVSGLNGTGLVLQLNGGGGLQVNANGAFIFTGLLADGSPYAVTIGSQPTTPNQTCTVTNGSGTVAGANVASIAVNCVDVTGPTPPPASTFGVGGTVRGVVGTGLTLRLNGVEDLPIVSNGAFAFDTRLSAGATYTVAIQQPPANPSQSCTIARGSGTIAADVTNIEVACAGNSRTVGGSVSGLLGSGLVLQNNGSDDLPIGSNGPFTFGRALADGSSYRVTVRTRPSNPSQTCTIANGAGTLAGANVTNVSVACETSNFTVGGTVSGLEGSRLVLRNNGGDELTIDENGRFTFPTGLPSGARYDVEIASQPVNPTQQCSVEHGSGTVGNNDVTSVEVRCATAGFRISVRVQHLRGSGLVLQNNGGDDLHIASDGRFNFPTPLPSGSSYNITIARFPTHPFQFCTVEHGSGTVENEDVRDPRVRCSDEDD